MFFTKDGTLKLTQNLNFEVFHRNELYSGNILADLRNNSLLNNITLPVLKKLVEDAEKRFERVVGDIGLSLDSNTIPMDQMIIQSNSFKSYMKVELTLKIGIMPLEFEVHIPKLNSKLTKTLLEMKKKNTALERQVESLMKTLEETISILQLHSQIKVKIPKFAGVTELDNDQILAMLNEMNEVEIEEADIVDSIADKSKLVESHVRDSNLPSKEEGNAESTLIGNVTKEEGNVASALIGNVASREEGTVASALIGQSQLLPTAQLNQISLDSQVGAESKADVAQSLVKPENADQSLVNLTEAEQEAIIIEKRKREREAQLLKSKQAAKKKKKLF